MGINSCKNRPFKRPSEAMFVSAVLFASAILWTARKVLFWLWALGISSICQTRQPIVMKYFCYSQTARLTYDLVVAAKLLLAFCAPSLTVPQKNPGLYRKLRPFVQCRPVRRPLPHPFPGSWHNSRNFLSRHHARRPNNKCLMIMNKISVSICTRVGLRISKWWLQL